MPRTREETKIPKWCHFFCQPWSPRVGGKFITCCLEMLTMMLMMMLMMTVNHWKMLDVVVVTVRGRSIHVCSSWLDSVVSTDGSQWRSSYCTRRHTSVVLSCSRHDAAVSRRRRHQSSQAEAAATHDDLSTWVVCDCAVQTTSSLRVSAVSYTRACAVRRRCLQASTQRPLQLLA